MNIALRTLQLRLVGLLLAKLCMLVCARLFIPLLEPGQQRAVLLQSLARRVADSGTRQPRQRSQPPAHQPQHLCLEAATAR